ncbi:MAG TPA: hypothetical protein VFV40_00105 [Nocardioides sp.]|nr:hypothetical protein [Nocardioides sp.]
MRRIRAGSSPARPSRVVLHVGAPLVASRYVRDVLTRNRRRLTRHGVLHPASHVGAEGHHAAVLDVLDLAAPGVGTVTGTWERLAQAARDWRRGTVVVSHELLADADDDQVARIVGSFGSAEVHVVYAARDLARQLPLAWQEWVRNGGTATFEGYVDKVLRRDSHRLAQVFWRSHDVADVLERWTPVVGPEHVHVVTAPTGPDQDAVVWQRVAQVLGVDAGRFRAPAPTGRPLDALAATEAARLLNQAGAPRLPHAALRAVAGPGPAVHAHHVDRLETEAERAMDAVKRTGCAVLGDVTDLRPDPDALTDDPARVTPPPDAVVATQTALLAALLR